MSSTIGDWDAVIPVSFHSKQSMAASTLPQISEYFNMAKTEKYSNTLRSNFTGASEKLFLQPFYLSENVGKSPRSGLKHDTSWISPFSGDSSPLSTRSKLSHRHLCNESQQYHKCSSSPLSTLSTPLSALDISSSSPSSAATSSSIDSANVSCLTPVIPSPASTEARDTRLCYRLPETISNQQKSNVAGRQVFFFCCI